MDHRLERRYFVERIMEFLQSLDEEVSDLHLADEHRVLFRLHGRPFEVLAWINSDSDMICVTTRTADLAITDFDEAVHRLQGVMETCWEYCISVSRVDSRYDLSMALFVGGFTPEAFEAVIHNLMSCATSIEDSHLQKEDDGDEEEVGEEEEEGDEEEEAEESGEAKA